MLRRERMAESIPEATRGMPTQFQPLTKTAPCTDRMLSMPIPRAPVHLA